MWFSLPVPWCSSCSLVSDTAAPQSCAFYCLNRLDADVKGSPSLFRSSCCTLSFSVLVAVTPSKRVAVMAKFSFVSAVLPVVVLCLSLYLQLPERLILPVIRVFFDISHSSTPTVHDKDLDVKYRGISSDKAEIFQNVFYGADTAGQGRFAPPIRFTPAPGSVVDATTPGAMCPQAKGDAAFPFTSPTTNISENCLSLKIARPTRTSSMANLPVIVYLHGGAWLDSQSCSLSDTQYF